jgi:phosphoribosylglycinamide formyltransferase-1
VVNLVADLRAGEFAGAELAAARERIEAAGFAFERTAHPPERFYAWIDEQFGGTWSSEAFAGVNIIASEGDTYAGFATFDPRGLEYSWLRGLGRSPGVGIFGPFGVAPQFRGSPIGPALLRAALASLAASGYERALIPAVGRQKLIDYYIRHGGAVVAERFEREQWRRPRRAIVLASGNGTNLQSVIDGVRDGRLPLKIALLICNKRGAYALERARRAEIPAIALPWDRKALSRDAYDAAVIAAAQRADPELVLLLGWMHLLPESFVAAFPQTLNIHPAFLPLDQRSDTVTFPDGEVTPVFRGARALADALAWGSRWAGASAHRLTLDADRGPVLVRKPLRIGEGEPENEILERLHALEHEVLTGAICRWLFER